MLVLVFLITRVLTRDVSGNWNRIRSCLRKDRDMESFYHFTFHVSSMPLGKNPISSQIFSIKTYSEKGICTPVLACIVFFFLSITFWSFKGIKLAYFEAFSVWGCYKNSNLLESSLINNKYVGAISLDCILSYLMFFLMSRYAWQYLFFYMVIKLSKL